jgi:hypothetical protein
MKVLFLARHFTYFRNFESVLRLLAEQGHQVHLAAERDEQFGGREMIDRLLAGYPSLSSGVAPERADRWTSMALKLRMGIGYLRYLDPAYDGTPKLRARAAERVPDLFLRLSRTPPFRGPAGRRRLSRLLTALEQAIPPDPAIDAFVRDHRPDVVLITPLIGISISSQLDFFYASMRLGIPVALCVWSWDHLSSKALIRTCPDRLLVWNPTQRREAIEMHGVPGDRVVVTGAQCFDQWFDRSPSRDRAAFCRDVGLRDDRPFLLWVCSALFRGSPVEAGFVLEWIQALRGHGDPALADVNILVRPHPSRAKEWQSVGPLPEGVTLWGANPVDAGTRADYFDSLYYSAAVAGLNTSAFIEAAIVGRQVYAVLPAQYHDNQEGTIHFHYLLNIGGGLLHASRTLDEHAAQLARQLTRPDEVPDRSRAFVDQFVRPNGHAEPSTPRFADAVAELAALRPAPLRVVSPRWACTSLDWLTSFAEGPGRRVMLSARGRMEADALRAHTEVKVGVRDVKIAGKQRRRAEKERTRADRYRQKRRREWAVIRQRLVGRVRAVFGSGETLD